MAQFQAIFEIKDSTYLMIQEGTLRYSGGVIRWADGPHKGEIFEHVQFTDMKRAKEAVDEVAKEGIAGKVIEFAEENKKVLIVVAISTFMAAIGAGIYKWYRNRYVKVFNKALKQYVNAINDGVMDEYIIDGLVAAIDNLKAQKNYEKIKISMSVFEIEALILDIRKYTLALAEANNKDINEDISFISNDDKIIDLQEYLLIQKNVLSAN